jgi:tetratricopeptide (TPR) repeat protein
MRPSVLAGIGLNLHLRLLAQAWSDSSMWGLIAIVQEVGLHVVKKLVAADFRRGRILRTVSRSGMTIAMLLALSPMDGRSQAPDWHARVRKYTETRDWNSAMRLVEEEIACAPQDMDVRAWRARVLAWSGKLPEAEKEYLEILQVSRTDPDNWMGLASVYLREGKIEEARRAISTAEELDPRRSDIHSARARILRAAGQWKQAQSEFQSALRLDPGSMEARAGLISLRRGAQHELRFGQDNDLLNYSADFHDEFVSLVSQWTSHWATSAAGDFYERPGAEAGKLAASITGRQSKWGAFSLGGAVARDNPVIPKSEAFFSLDHGWKTGEAGFVRGLESAYAQHWYWYQAARVLTLNGTAVVYLPQGWTFTLAATGARSAFSGTTADWKPSGTARLGFPLKRWGDRRLSGNVFFAAGTENFAIVDQIGSFASQTYGGGLRFQITSRQDISGFAGYQKRTQNRTDANFGLSYGIHF